MKGWLWLLGISMGLILSCESRADGRGTASVASMKDSVPASDTAEHSGLVDAVNENEPLQSDTRAKMETSPQVSQDTVKRYPIIHVGDKDFDPNRFLGPNATEAQRKYARKMIAEDSLRRLRSQRPTPDSTHGK